ncbi:hypothetical protein N7510_010251 [Penicillium lagena]|uniref:uncharacterized protein n=1 Tax=Penicillium lagena TaxID=94218 RepID=UPI00253FD0FC|nr:uncharacterized protein N7510_010251 [Penicillium lagena]KAJ5605097.1 hypothetical protein N7510_010251 [Penicillium lagena]
MAIFPVEKLFVRTPMDLNEDPRSAQLLDSGHSAYRQPEYQDSDPCRFRYRIATRGAPEMAKHSIFSLIFLLVPT